MSTPDRIDVLRRVANSLQKQIAELETGIAHTAEENAMDDEDRQRYEDTTLACGFAAAALVLCLVASVGGAWSVVRALIGWVFG